MVMKRFDLNGMASTSTSAWGLGVSIIRFSWIWFVKNEVMIESSRETILWFRTRYSATEGTVKSWSAKYLIEVSASLSVRRYASMIRLYTFAKCVAEKHDELHSRYDSKRGRTHG